MEMRTHQLGEASHGHATGTRNELQQTHSLLGVHLPNELPQPDYLVINVEIR